MIHVHIQSYKRSNDVKSLDLYADAFIWVHEFEAEEYKKNYKNVKVLSDDLRGNLPKVKNFILDAYPNDINVFLDDDMSALCFWENGTEKPIEDLTVFVEHYSEICEGLGFAMWGVNVNPDKQNYREYTPFATTCYVSSSFAVFLPTNKLRYDEKLPLKEDYDMTIQQCNTYRGLLRVNKAFYKKKSAENVGGCATYRNVDFEKEQLLDLQKKWGSRIVKMDSLTTSRSHSSNKKRNFDINPIVKIPIAGV